MFDTLIVFLKEFFEKIDLEKSADNKLEDLKRSPDLLNNVKISQGQPRFIICGNLVRPTSPMLHTKYQGHWLFGSREDI